MLLLSLEMLAESVGSFLVSSLPRISTSDVLAIVPKKEEVRLPILTLSELHNN